MNLDWLARFFAGLVRRESDSAPLGKSRLDREGDRMQLGCVIILLLLTAAFVWWAS